VIPASQVTTPVPIGTALLDLGSLLSSVNPADFRTVETFLTTAFSGAGPALRTLVVTGQNLFNALAAAQTANIDLIQDGQPVLNAFQQTDDQFGEFAQGLAQVTAQLKSSNADLKALIDNGTSAEAAVNPFLADNTDSLESTIQSLGTSSGVAQTYQPEVQALFQVLPLVASNLAGSAPGGQVRGELAINTEEPVCPYEAASEVPSPETPEATVPMDNGCTSSLPGLLARGFKG
jgi:phospholipid/cholesterol/gamma-HCH transport system substrate-binding protein